MFSFKPGDKVRFKNETGEGLVTQVSAKEIVVVDADGFEYTYAPSELIPHEDLPIDSLSYIPPKEDSSARKQAPKKSSKERSEKIVDLHAHEITPDSTRGWSNYEILTLQLNTARRALQTSRGSGINKLILIHGVGDGVLRSEIHNWLRGEAFIDFYDADYRRFGAGATEIEIKKGSI